MARYVALLRGINVGGNNLIPMPALKAFFEARGYREVSTYIQSGNVLFSSAERVGALVDAIEAGLSRRFGYRASVFVRSREQLRRIVAGAPAGFGAHPTRFRYDVVFLREPLSPGEALTSVTAAPGVDAVWPGQGVLYFSRLTAKASQSRLARLTSTAAYQRMTIRNWNTTTRLLELLGARAA